MDVPEQEVLTSKKTFAEIYLLLKSTGAPYLGTEFKANYKAARLNGKDKEFALSQAIINLEAKLVSAKSILDRFGTQIKDENRLKELRYEAELLENNAIQDIINSNKVI